MKSSAAESLKLRKNVQELERLLQESRSLQEKLENEITGYQSELPELRYIFLCYEYSEPKISLFIYKTLLNELKILICI